jgi:hypothetical protein
MHLKLDNSEDCMGILVCYDDYTYDVVNDYQLDFLIKTHCISGYVASGNWIRVEDDPRKPLDARIERSNTLQNVPRHLEY